MRGLPPASRAAAGAVWCPGKGGLGADSSKQSWTLAAGEKDTIVHLSLSPML